MIQHENKFNSEYCMEHKIKKMILSYCADVCGISGIERFGNAPTGFSPKDIFEDCKSVIEDGKVHPNGKCTMCYRCASDCLKQAITLLGPTVYEQCKIEKYI